MASVRGHLSGRLMPGAYHTDPTAEDVAAGVIYDKGPDLSMRRSIGVRTVVCTGVFPLGRGPQFPRAVED